MPLLFLRVAHPNVRILERFQSQPVDASGTVASLFCCVVDVVALRPRNSVLSVAGAGLAVLTPKGRKSLVQTELWS